MGRRWAATAKRLGGKPSAAPVVLATLAGCDDFDRLTRAASTSADRHDAGKKKGRYVSAYLLAVLQHRVAVESGAIPQTRGVE